MYVNEDFSFQSLIFSQLKFEAVNLPGGVFTSVQETYRTIQCGRGVSAALCSQLWTSARGNLRMAGAAKPRSPSRVEI